MLAQFYTLPNLAGSQPLVKSKRSAPESFALRLGVHIRRSPAGASLKLRFLKVSSKRGRDAGTRTTNNIYAAYAQVARANHPHPSPAASPYGPAVALSGDAVCYDTKYRASEDSCSSY